MNRAFLDYYRCPEAFATFVLIDELSEDPGYFRVGPGAIVFGRSSSGFRAERPTDDIYDALTDVVADGATLRLPFNASEIADNLRCERYTSLPLRPRTRPFASTLRDAYYLARPLLPFSMRKRLQRIRLSGWQRLAFPEWPVDSTVERIFEQLLVQLLQNCSKTIPFIWFWPDGAPGCAIMTHDVETATGGSFCSTLMDLDDSCGIKSSFQIIPEDRYPVSARFLDSIRDRGFEINIHDLNHDGRLFADQERFARRAERINRYGREYGAAGFRSGALYRNLDWCEELEFAYDMSVPSVGHLEMQRGGCCSVTPFFVGEMLELPVTTTQDYSLFHILGQYSIDIWKRQIALILARHGLASFIIHPDYTRELRARATYTALLAYLVQLRSEAKMWIALPREVNQWWRERSRMRLVPHGHRWAIEGRGHERARIAYASLDEGRLVYSLEAPVSGHQALRSTA